MPNSGDSNRRRLLQGLCAVGIGVPATSRGDDDEAAAAPPEPGDFLVYAYGGRAGEIMLAADLEIGAEQILAYPMAAETSIVRDGTRLNQIVVIRLDPSWLSEATLARSAGGVVAYSGVCTHTGCDIVDWNREARRFQCPCHESQFDPSDGARVVGGPAPWQLAALPLDLVDGRLAVAGPFEGRVGFQQPGLNPFGL